MNENNKNTNQNKSVLYALKAKKYMHIGIIPLALFLIKMTARHLRSLKQNSMPILIGIYVIVIVGYLLFYGIINLIIYILKKKYKRNVQ